MRGNENGIASSRKISSRLLSGVGFSNGCAELALKKPPPLVPISLMASCDATGPPSACWVPPARVAISVCADRFWITPMAISTTATTTDSGSRIRTTVRTRSDQKLPTRPSAAERARPRISATTTAMPTAADRKFCTAKPAIWSRCPAAVSPEYHCQFVLVTNETAVFHAPAGSIAGAPIDSGRWLCSRSSP